jgi:protein-disulfide isomerase
MRSPRNIAAVLIAAVALAAGYLGATYFWPSTLTFTPRDAPPGFRDLVLDHTVSQPDPMLSVPDLSDAGASPRPSGREICEALMEDNISPTAGDAKGSVPLITFFDYRCPYCKVLDGILPSLPLENVRVMYREWAILGPSSVLAARAALAADRQGKYLPLHERLMRARLILTIDYIDALAGDLGIDRARLHADMNAPRTALALRGTATLAGALGFLGTPGLVVGRTIVQGEISRRDLEALIAEEKRSFPQKPC